VAYVLDVASRYRLTGVHGDLVRLAHAAVARSPVAFAISEGLRSRARQQALVEAGTSLTLNSRHLTGHAVDVVALVGGRPRWDFLLYRQIAEAFRDAGDALGIGVEWGACWQPINGREDLAALVAEYVAGCRAAGAAPLIDGPHFQLPWQPPREAGPR
jgi:peptidoglycan L-alanyl-D-glutamate endopeptidase CwlK